jgi:atypical dual specificity phosphatase
MPPPAFSWVDQPHLAALAFPDSPDDLKWLRKNGIEVLISLTETPAPRQWVNEAGLMALHVPVPDMEPPTERQIEIILDAIQRANKTGMGVAIHCAAGKGRTGTALAAYFVTQGLSANVAIEKVRSIRPGSIETTEQALFIVDFENRKSNGTT